MMLQGGKLVTPSTTEPSRPDPPPTEEPLVKPRNKKKKRKRRRIEAITRDDAIEVRHEKSRKRKVKESLEDEIELLLHEDLYELDMAQVICLCCCSLLIVGMFNRSLICSTYEPT